MDAALISVPVVKKNREVFEKTVLLNSNKVRNFRADSVDTNYTLVYYDLRGDRRQSVYEFKVALTVAQFDALLDEPTIEPTIPLYVTYRRKPWKFGKKVAVNRVEYYNVDSFVFAWDNADALSSTVIVDEGAFRLVELQTAHTISMIDERASTSASYSESGI